MSASKAVSVVMSAIGLTASTYASYLLYNLVNANTTIWLLFGMGIVISCLGFVLSRISDWENIGTVISGIGTGSGFIIYYILFNQIKASPGMWSTLGICLMATLLTFTLEWFISERGKILVALFGILAILSAVYNGYLLFSFVEATTLMWCLFWVGVALTFFGAVIFTASKSQ